MKDIKKIANKVKSKLKKEAKIETLFDEYIFGTGKFRIDQNLDHPANIWVAPNGEDKKEFKLHHDAIDDFIELLKKAQKKMEKNLK